MENQIIEYFEFIPRHFIDKITNAAIEGMYDAAEYISQQIATHYKQFSEKQIQDGMQKFLTLQENAVDRNFELFELYVMKNIFMFPKNVNPNRNVLEQADPEIDNKIKAVMEQILAEYSIQKELEHEISQEDKLISQLEDLQSSMQLIDSSLKQFDLYPLSDSTEFLVKNMTDLKLLLKETMKLAEKCLSPNGLIPLSERTLKEYEHLVESNEYQKCKIAEELANLEKTAPRDALVKLLNFFKSSKNKQGL